MSRLLPVFFACVLSFPAGLALAESVTIRTTAHGVPHIEAASHRGLGYGQGWTMAANDICTLADAYVTVAGERSAVYGPDETLVQFGQPPIRNDAADAVYRLTISDALVAEGGAAVSNAVSDAIDGYVAGYNRWLADTDRADDPEACRGSKAIRPITRADVLRRLSSGAMWASTGQVLRELHDAAPPGSPDIGQPETVAASHEAADPRLLGSNALALGRGLSANGRGLLLGNPHFFWTGSNRFIQQHLTVPGDYDVMGMTMIGVPTVMIGFNDSLAWTHTVSTDKRGGVYRLALDPADPTRYLLDGESVAMTRLTVNGHEFWMTEFGPVLESGDLPWDTEQAYAFFDANRNNHRQLDQWYRVGRSKTVEDLDAGLKAIVGMAWINTVAADAGGDVLYSDASVAIGLDRAAYDACAIDRDFAKARFFALLDGTRSECLPATFDDAPHGGILPGPGKPSLIRSDYVQNSNASHWLTHPDALLEGFSGAVGPERSVVNARTRQGHVQVADRAAGRDGLPGNRYDTMAVQQILFSARNGLAETTVDELVEACEASPVVTLDDRSTHDLTRACSILKAWNRRDDLDSRGAHVFREFARIAGGWSGDPSEAEDFWRIPFDPADPVHTPRGLDTSTDAPLKALARAVDRLEEAQIPLDARLGDIQFVERNGERIPLHGGLTYSMLLMTLKPGLGYTEPVYVGNSYIQVVTFDENGPVAKAILASSQSPDPRSPYYADQTRMYSRKEWARLPFTAEEIAAAEVEPVRVLETD